MTPRLVVPAVAGLIGLAVALAAWGTGALDRVENDTVDARFEAREVPAPRDTVVVAIDERSISQLGRWPFSRREHARAIDALRLAEPRLVVYDVQFTEPSADPEADLALYDAVSRLRGTILATSTSAPDGSTDVLGGDENLARAGATAGAANLPADEGGMIRRYEAATGRLPSLAMLVADRLGDPPRPADFPAGGAWIDYRGGPGTFTTVSFADLVRGNVDRDVLRDRVVIVGAAAPTLQDLHPTPTSGSEQMSGPEIQANAFWTARHGNPLRDAPGWMNVLALALLAFVPPIAIAGRRVLTTLAVAGAMAGAFVVAALLLFNEGMVVRVVAPLLALAVATVVAVVLGAVLEARDRRRVARANAELEVAVEQRTRELHDAYREIVRRLAMAAESRDDETGGHIERISRLTHQLALAAGLPDDEAEMIRHASLMHDVGKIAIPDDILRKPGMLTGAEWEVMRGHTLAGARILAGSHSPLVQMAEEIARTHHEKWDGTGYPAGLEGEEIPLAGRITAICDVFDALVSARHYKAAWRVDEAIAEIERQRGRHFDPQLVDLFVALVPELPGWLTGSHVAEQILRETARSAPAIRVDVKTEAPAPERPPAPPVHAQRPR